MGLCASHPLCSGCMHADITAFSAGPCICLCCRAGRQQGLAHQYPPHNPWLHPRVRPFIMRNTSHIWHHLGLVHQQVRSPSAPARHYRALRGHTLTVDSTMTQDHPCHLHYCVNAEGWPRHLIALSTWRNASKGLLKVRTDIFRFQAECLSCRHLFRHRSVWARTGLHIEQLLILLMYLRLLPPCCIARRSPAIQNL